METHKILTGKYYVVAVPNIGIATTLTTGSNDLRPQKNRTRYDLCEFFFTNRVVNTWNNSLPNSVVHAESTDIWSNQEIIYNHHAKIHTLRKSKSIYCFAFVLKINKSPKQTYNNHNNQLHL